MCTKLEPLPCREIAEGQDTKDCHNAQYSGPRKWIMKPLERALKQVERDCHGSPLFSQGVVGKLRDES